jgi:Protein of unknown function (DUF3800)
MAILNAYFDESGKHHEHPVVTLTAVCVSQPNLAAFDNAWNALLRQYGLRALHMVDAMKNRKLSPNVPAQTSDERVDAMKPFADCINRNLEYGLVQAIDVRGFNALSKGMRAGLGSPDDPYFIAFQRAILEMIDCIHSDDRISLVCDYDNATAWDCFRHWKGVRNSHDLIRKMTISLAFADDEYFPALQAADMVAYLARLEAVRQFHGRQYSYKPLLDYLIDKRPSASTLRWGVMFANEALMRSLKTTSERLNEIAKRIGT